MRQRPVGEIPLKNEGRKNRWGMVRPPGTGIVKAVVRRAKQAAGPNVATVKVLCCVQCLNMLHVAIPPRPSSKRQNLHSTGLVPACMWCHTETRPCDGMRVAVGPEGIMENAVIASVEKA